MNTKRLAILTFLASNTAWAQFYTFDYLTLVGR